MYISSIIHGFFFSKSDTESLNELYRSNIFYFASVRFYYSIQWRYVFPHNFLMDAERLFRSGKWLIVNDKLLLNVIIPNGMLLDRRHISKDKRERESKWEDLILL